MTKKILVPIDVSHEQAGGAALSLANDMAKLKGAKLVLLNVVERVPAFVESQLPEGYAEAAVSAASEKLTEFAGSLDLEAAPEIVVRRGHPSTEILEYAEAIGADLIVIASHEPELADYLLGSVAARVVRHASCSVLVVRKSAD